MSSVLVKLDGQAIAGVITDYLHVATVSIEGVTFVDEYASLSVSGGTYFGEHSNDHKVWVSGLALRAGQVVDVSLLKERVEIGTGEPIRSTPHLADSESQSIVPSTDVEDESTPLPRLRSGHTVRLTIDGRSPITLMTNREEQGFRFLVSWNTVRSDKIEVVLGTYMLENADPDATGREVVREKVSVGRNIRLELVA